MIKHQHFASIIWALTLEKRNSKIFICKNLRTLLLALVMSKMLWVSFGILNFPLKLKYWPQHTHFFFWAHLQVWINYSIVWYFEASGFLKISGYKETMSINPLNESISLFCPFLIHNFFKREKSRKKSSKHPYQLKFYAEHIGFTPHCFVKVIFDIRV